MRREAKCRDQGSVAMGQKILTVFRLNTFSLFYKP